MLIKILIGRFGYLAGFDVLNLQPFGSPLLLNRLLGVEASERYFTDPPSYFARDQWGRGRISLALYWPTPSPAYGKIAATTLFNVGDLPALLALAPFIECVGLLHHLLCAAMLTGECLP